MELHELQKRAADIQALYNEINTKPWGVSEYTQGFAGDVGDLMKLVMAKEGLREKADVDAKLEHELADCLWSVLIIAQELDIDLEQSFTRTMDALEEKLSKKGEYGS